MIFYDSMLVDVTEHDRMDVVSSHGYAWGYIGSCVPFIISLVFVLMYDKIGITMGTAMMIAFFLNAAWWFIVTIPLLKNYEQVNFAQMPAHPVRDSFQRLGHTLKDIRREKISFYTCLLFSSLLMGCTRSLRWLLRMEVRWDLILPDCCSHF